MRQQNGSGVSRCCLHAAAPTAVRSATMETEWLRIFFVKFVELVASFGLYSVCQPPVEVLSSG